MIRENRITSLGNGCHMGPRPESEGSEHLVQILRASDLNIDVNDSDAVL